MSRTLPVGRQPNNSRAKRAYTLLSQGIRQFVRLALIVGGHLLATFRERVV
jgi:hypothetical protein